MIISDICSVQEYVIYDYKKCIAGNGQQKFTGMLCYAMLLYLMPGYASTHKRMQIGKLTMKVPTGKHIVNVFMRAVYNCDEPS